MGQRLNLEITDNEKTLANSYYHWSAYTGSAIALTRIVIDKYESLKEERDNILGDSDESRIALAAELLEETGSGVNEDEYERIKSLSIAQFHQFARTTGRNDGLLSVTPEGIEETERWEEGRVSVNIESETFSFDVFFSETKSDWGKNCCMSTTEISKTFKEMQKITPEIDLDGELGFDEIEDLYNLYEESDGQFFDNRTNLVITWVQ